MKRIGNKGVYRCDIIVKRNHLLNRNSGAMPTRQTTGSLRHLGSGASRKVADAARLPGFGDISVLTLKKLSLLAVIGFNRRDAIWLVVAGLVHRRRNTMQL